MIGKIAGPRSISRQNQWFPVDFPLNQATQAATISPPRALAATTSRAHRGGRWPAAWYLGWQVGVSINENIPMAGWFRRDDFIEKWMKARGTPIYGNLQVPFTRDYKSFGWFLLAEIALRKLMRCHGPRRRLEDVPEVVRLKGHFHTPTVPSFDGKMPMGSPWLRGHGDPPPGFQGNLCWKPKSFNHPMLLFLAHQFWDRASFGRRAKRSKTHLQSTWPNARGYRQWVNVHVIWLWWEPVMEICGAANRGHMVFLSHRTCVQLPMLPEATQP